MPYRFSPPSFATGEALTGRMDEPSRRLFGHFRAHDRGFTVRKTVDGNYIQSTETYSADTTDESVAVLYLGGHYYDVSDAEAADLTAAGYGDQLVPI